MEHLGYFVEISETEVRFQLEKPADGVRYWGDGINNKKAIELIKIIPDGEIDPDELLIKVRECRTKKALRKLWDSNPAYQDYPFKTNRITVIEKALEKLWESNLAYQDYPFMFGHQSTKIKYNDYDHS